MHQAKAVYCIYLKENTIVTQLEYNQNTIFNNKSLGSRNTLSPFIEYKICFLMPPSS